MTCNRTPASPISLYTYVEQTAQTALQSTLPLQIQLLGVPVKHSRQLARPENDVYGRAGGITKNATLRFLGNEKVLMGASHWRAIDNNEAGYLEQPGYLYCEFDLQDGDVLTVIRISDKQEIEFTAEQVQEIGDTVTILKRFIMSNINGS